MHRAGLRRLGARIEPVPVSHVLRTERRGQVSVGPVHLAGDQGIGALPVGRRRPPVVDVPHERGPGRRHDPATAGVVLQDTLLDVVSHPDAGDELRRVPDEPGVGIVVGGARLAGGRVCKPGFPHGGEGGAAADHVLHHVHHQPGVLAVHHVLTPGVGLPEDIALAVLHAQDADRFRWGPQLGEGLVVAWFLDKYDPSRMGIIPSVVSSSSFGCHSELSSWTTGVLSGESSRISVTGWPARTAAEYTNGLKVEPGWRIACVARLYLESSKSRPPIIARMYPVFASSATSAPWR